MKDIKNMKCRSLKWFRRGRLEGHYELIGEDAENYGTLDRKSILTERALASCAYGDYDLTWRGFLRRHVPIMDTASNQEIGRLKLGFMNSGELGLDNGRKYRFEREGILKNRWSFKDDLDGTVCTISYSGWLATRKSGVDIVLGSAAVLGRDLILMMMVGWYAMNVISHEAGAVYSGG